VLVTWKSRATLVLAGLAEAPRRKVRASCQRMAASESSSPSSPVMRLSLTCACCREAVYSARKASVGSTLAARRAGR
jgi:hypothetical protein